MKHRVLGFFLCSILALLLSGCTNEEVSNASETDENSTLSSQLTDEIIEAIQYIEANAVLPERAAKIIEYQRFYAIFDANAKFGAFRSPGNKQDYEVVAIYAKGMSRGFWTKNTVKIPDMNGAYFTEIDRLPLIMDGGCSVISIWFNSEDKKFFRMSDPFGPIDEKSNQKLFDGLCNGLA